MVRRGHGGTDRVRGRFAARRWAVPAAAVALLGTGLVSGPAPAGAAPTATAPAGELPVPELDWVDCGGGFDCATAAVPLDYDRPSGPTVDIAMRRRPADDQANRIGSLFLNPGGPGGSGVDFVDAAEFLFAPVVLDRFDVIGFDPRGIGDSTPATCFDDRGDLVTFLRGQPVFPVTRAEEAQYIRTYGRLADLCAANGGRILANMSTADVARDLDQLRRAVGDERLNFAGYSYGSILGQTYVNLFPDRVRAVIVDGVLSPLDWVGVGDAADIPFSARVGSAESAYDTLQGFLSDCDAAGLPACPFAGGDPRAKYDALADRLRRAEFGVPSGGGQVPIGYDELVAITLGSLYSPYGWAELAAFLQFLYEATDPAAAGAAYDVLVARLGGPLDNAIVSFPAVSCLDSTNPSNPYVWPAAAAEADERAPYFGRLWTWASIPCAEWPVSDDDRYTGPWDAFTSETVLVIGTRFDPATPYRSAELVSDLLPNARLLTLEGYGHTSLAQSRCVDRYVAQYLVGTALPSEGAICQTDVVPFPEPGSGPTDRGRAAVPRPVPPQVRIAVTPR